jgi:biopolymer transport protein ExbB/TolQ
MSQSTAIRERRSRVNLAAFGLGVPVAVGFLYLMLYGPLRDSEFQHYFKHRVEQVEVIGFCCCAAALASKMWRARTERAALRARVLPDWDGHPVPVTEARALLLGLDRLPRRLQNTWLVLRVANVLDFVCNRGSADELDDHLRTLTDNDALAHEGSYALVRLITWAIPILGFLGTVLGITGAISGVTPEKLEKDLSAVTDGLALAFDTTAVGLALTMVAMFLSYLAERAEQSVLDSVDRFADRELAHRFERLGSDGSEYVAVLRKNTQVVLQSCEQLVQRQADIWAKTFEEAERRRATQDRQTEDRIGKALEMAIHKTLDAHTQRLATFEKQSFGAGAELMKQLTGLADAVRNASREQQGALTSVAQAVASQVEACARLQDNEQVLLRLQETLNRNLTALATAGTLEQAVQSLTAAIHIMTAKASVVPPQVTATRLSSRPGAAA